jgi:rubrerythrin
MTTTTIPLYAADGVTIVGNLVDGVYTPIQQALPPAPEGDALDDLLDECCHTIEGFFGSYKRLHPDLQLNEGQHSLILTDGTNKLGLTHFGHEGVRSWIVRGTLRNVNELTPVLNAFMSDMTRKVRLRKISPDWRLDNDGLIILSSCFGLQAPRTFAELAAKREADRAARERRNAERAEADRQRREQYLASPEGQAAARRDADRQLRLGIVETVLKAIVGEFEPIHLSKDSTEAESNAANVALLDWRAENRRVEPTIAAVAKATKWSAEAIITIWKELDREYLELVEVLEGIPQALDRLPTLEDFCMQALVKKANESISVDTKPVPWTPSSAPPVIEGVERTLMTRQQWYDETRANGDAWFRDGVRVVTRLDDKHDFVIDVVPDALWDAYESQCRLHEDTQKMLGHDKTEDEPC